MISQSKTSAQLKEKFLDSNPTYEEIVGKNPTIGEFHNINEDEDVWIMQCPKGTDITALKDEKIKLPGRTNQDGLELLAIGYTEPVLHAFGYKNRKGKNGIKIVPIQGNIILRKRIKPEPPTEETQIETKAQRVHMPASIKVRHPLHGSDYYSKIQIDPRIAQLVKQADEIPSHLPQKTKSKAKRKSKSKDLKTIPLDSDGEVELVTQSKKKKKQKYNSETGDVDTTIKAKKRKKSLHDDVSEDLRWIQNL